MVATNIGEQVEQTVEATKRGGVPKTTLEVVRDKYKEGRENIKSNTSRKCKDFCIIIELKD